MPICGEKIDNKSRRKHGKQFRTIGDIRKGQEAKESLKQMQEEAAFERYQEVRVSKPFILLFFAV
jgi:hypothetical protein